MARDILSVVIGLERIHCFDEGDSAGTAEPYLWPVFFKIDGETVTLTESLKLSGTATVIGTYGNHGNLGNTDVDEGDDLTIPESLGSWHTTLKPISSQSVLRADAAGVAGVVAVLMEEDNVSDSGAVAGYNALVAAIQSGLDKFIETFVPIVKEDVDKEAIKKAAEKAIEDAIKSNQSFFENLWSFLDKDDQIGSEVFSFGHDDLAKGDVINFDKRWENEGDWQIFGATVGAQLRKHPRFLADLTGDRRSDIVGFGDAGVWVALSNGNGAFQAPQFVVANFGYDAGVWRVERHPRFLADLTGDRRSGIVGFPEIEVKKAKRIRLTGDRRSDIVGFGDAGVWIAFSNGNGTFQAPQFVVANFGYDDDAGRWRVERHPRFLADLTGDGRADIVGFENAGVRVALNNGNGTFQAPQLVVANFGYDAGGWRVERHPRFLADLTGDGCADIVGFGNAGVHVALNNGNGTFQA